MGELSILNLLAIKAKKIINKAYVISTGIPCKYLIDSHGLSMTKKIYPHTKNATKEVALLLLMFSVIKLHLF